MTIGGGWSDKTLTSAKQDTLGREPFALKVADLIDTNHSNESSTVYGLTGAWGSGKSSLLAMVRESLEIRGAGWIIREFTPWAANDIGSLIGEFFSTITDALPDEKTGTIGKGLAALARVSIPALKAVPVVGSAAFEAADRALETFVARPPWQKQFVEASKLLADSKLRLVIVTDDLDRLHPDELFTLLKVVRLLGRFPGVDYLLAYDEETITDVLASSPLSGKKRERARRFMEKIVQFPIAIPPAQEAHLIERLNGGLAEIFKQHSRPLDDSDGRIALARDVLLHRLKTLRAVDRYLAQVHLYLPLVQAGDINDVDVLLLTFVRLHFPELYAALPAWKTHLTRSSARATILVGRSLNEKETDWALLLDLVHASEKEEAREVLSLIFPIVQGYSGSLGEQRACESDYFDRYFAFGIPIDDISDVLVSRAVEDLAAGGDTAEVVALREAAVSENSGVASVALNKARRATGNLPRELLTESLAVNTARFLGTTSKQTNLFFSPRDIATHWLADTLRGLSDPSSGFAQDLLDTGASPTDLLKAVSYAIEPDYEQKLANIGSELASALANLVEGHLQSGDDADDEFLFRTAVGLVNRFTDGRSLQLRIQDGVTRNEYSAEDVASRCVGLAYSSGTGGAPELHDFDIEMFRTMEPNWLPDPAAAPSHPPDKYDISWPNRRLFAKWAIANDRNEHPSW